MDTISAAMLATGLSVFVSLTDKYLLSRLNPRAITAIIGVFGVLCALLLPITGTPNPSSDTWLLGALTGTLFAAVILFAFEALKQGEVSRLAPLSVLSTLAIIIGGIVFFDEPFTSLRLVAFALLILGAVLLATRFERHIEILDPAFYPRLFKRAHWHVVQTANDPFEHGARVTRQLSKDVSRNVRSAAHAVTHAQKLFVFRTRTRVRLVRGAGWYLACVILAIPYNLLVKEVVSTGGAVGGFVAIRVSLGVALLIVALWRWDETRTLRDRPGAALLAAIKEPVGILIGFLIAFALAHGELGVIRSITSLETVGIFLVSILLTRIGILSESLRPQDLIQKGAGALCMVLGSALLFL